MIINKEITRIVHVFLDERLGFTSKVNSEVQYPDRHRGSLLMNFSYFSIYDRNIQIQFKRAYSSTIVLLVYVFGYVDFIILNKFSVFKFFGSLNSLIGQKSTLVQS